MFRYASKTAAALRDLWKRVMNKITLVVNGLEVSQPEIMSLDAQVELLQYFREI
jgi:hypothetical protein